MGLNVYDRAAAQKSKDVIVEGREVSARSQDYIVPTITQAMPCLPDSSSLLLKPLFMDTP